MKKTIVKIKEVLVERNITQKELAQKANLRESTISDICRNKKTCINIIHLQKIANALNISDIRELITLEDK